MNDEVFTVYDSAARRYLQPFCAPTIDVAVRMFTALVNQADHPFAKYPDDYTLIHIGAFDAEIGRLFPLEVAHPLGIAITFVERPHE